MTDQQKIKKLIADVSANIAEIESILRKRITEIGTGEASRRTGETQANFSQFQVGKRKFSMKKITEFVNKIF